MATATQIPGVAPRTDPSVRERYFVWVILFITALTYGGALRFEFAWDDFPQIVFNPFVKAWHYVPQYFTSSVWKQLLPFSPINYYRPLFLLLVRVNHSIFRINPLGWHLVSVLLHVLVTWQVYVVVRKFSGQFSLAWLTAAFFGLHPVHHEVVAWVSSQTESLLAIMFLAAFWAYLKARENLRPRSLYWMGLSSAFYLLALFSKETAILLPVLVFTFEWIDYEPGEKGLRSSRLGRFPTALLTAATYIPVTLLYLVARNHALMGLVHPGQAGSIGQWLLTLPSLLVFYIRHFFYPVHLAEFYDVYYQSRFTLAHTALPIVLVVLVAAVIWIGRNRFGRKAVAYAVAWSLIPIIPALNTLVFNPDQIVHDRYLYVPSIGLCFLVALVVDRAVQSRRVLFGQPAHTVIAGAAIGLILAFISVQEIAYWANDYAVFTRAHEVAPLNIAAAGNLSEELIARHHLDDAFSILQKSYQMNPRDYLTVFSIGRVYFEKNDLAQAELFLEQSRNLDPRLAGPNVMMGRIRAKQGRIKEAQDYMRAAVDLDPYSPSYHATYGIVLALGGNCAEADREFAAAKALNDAGAIGAIQGLNCHNIPGAPVSSSKPGLP